MPQQKIETPAINPTSAIPPAYQSRNARKTTHNEWSTVPFRVCPLRDAKPLRNRDNAAEHCKRGDNCDEGAETAILAGESEAGDAKENP